MATITPVTSRIESHPRVAWHVIWETCLNGDTGTPVELVGHADRSVQIVGTFGVGGTIVLEGSNDGTNYVTLTDPQGNALSFTAAGLEAISELTRYIRVDVTAGDGSTDLDAHVVLSGVRDY